MDKKEFKRRLGEFFKEQKVETYYKQVFKLAGIESCVMTNDPLDPAEASVWNQGFPPDPCFHAALRLEGTGTRDVEDFT